MIKGVATRIVERQIWEGRLEKAQEDVYIYAYEVLINQMLNLFIAAGLAIVSQEIVAVTLFLLFYVPLRKYAGGYHAESNGKCVWYSSIVIVLVILLNKFVHFYCELEPEVCAAIFLLLLLFTQKVAPVEAQNKKIGKEEKRRCKQKIRRFGIAHIIVLILNFLVLKQSVITVNLILGYVILMVILFMGAKTQTKNILEERV